MMNQAINAAIETARAKAADRPEWLRAVEKAATMLASGELCVTLFSDNTALITSPNGSYRVNGACPCAAKTRHCYHRAAKRLVEMMETTTSGGHETAIPPTAPQDVVAARPALIADIKAVWPKTWPPLADELMRRFRVNKLEFLSIDFLMAVRAAIA